MKSFPSTVNVSELDLAIPGQFAFERIDPTAVSVTMCWGGSVQQVATEVGDMVRDNSLGSNFWHPSRVLRAIIDSPVDGNERVSLINDTTRFALGMYAGRPDGDLWDRIHSDITRLGIDNSRVNQIFDETTLASTTSDLSLQSAYSLADRVSGPLCFIPICHGGFVAGVQTILWHNRIKPGQDVTVYPVRHSRRKHGDKNLHLAEDELNHLREIAEGRTVMIFDEDASGGGTIKKAARYLRPQLPNTTILGRVNSDSRHRDCQKIQGIWWEKNRWQTAVSIAGVVMHYMILGDIE